MRRFAIRHSSFLAATAALAIGCHRPPTAIPGSTDISVKNVEIVAAPGQELDVDYGPLLETLGLRKGSLIRPERKFNPYRLNEDRRRVLTHARLYGRFEAVVDEPTIERGSNQVSVTFEVSEGPAYRIGAVHIVGAPEDTESLLRDMLPFARGDAIDMTVYRPFRRDLAERLQAEGYGHARVYSRTFVDRAKKEVIWYYFVDAGPATFVRSLVVAGNHRVPAEAILGRIEMAVGKPYDLRIKERVELSLLDSGAFRSVVVRHNADVLSGPPQWPDTGGSLSAAQIDEHGDLVPRQLDPGIDVRIVVVEAPARQLRLEAGAEADPTRLDVFAGGSTLFRDIVGTSHHIVLEGMIARGWHYDDDDGGNPGGLYGSALARYVRAGFLSPRLDLRLSARLRQSLFPDATVRELSAGPGVRAVPAAGLYLDFDALYLHARELDLPAIDAGTRMQLALADDDVSTGAALAASIILDRRNDRIEATRGHMVGLRAELSPGGALSSHRSLRIEADARQFVGLTPSWFLAVRGSATWVTLETDAGVPLHSRLFGGGSYGFRGLGRQRLATAAACESATDCDQVLVGGLSLAEASVEGRFLPHRALYGAVVFLDLGGVGAGSNPFEDGASLAAGLGARLRSWYVPVALDFAYRVLEDNELLGPTALGRFALFARVGEAF